MSDAAPAGGWDCHAHLFGPYARYPLAPQRSYTPPEALAAGYLALLDGLGLRHGVLVHPSAYGDDFSLLLDTLDASPRLRGVIVARPGMAPDLRGWHRRGVRAARFSHRAGAGTNFAGSASFDDLLGMRSALADAGMHAELWTDCASLPAIAGHLRGMPFPVVIDHMGGFDVDAGVDQPGFRTLLELVESGHVHVKLCVYRNLPGRTDLAPCLPFHRALVMANPERMLWGSDWPHLRTTPVPDAAALLDTLRGWVGDEATITRILDTNPRRLYDQGPST